MNYRELGKGTSQVSTTPPKDKPDEEKPLPEQRAKKRWEIFRVFKIGSIFQWTLSVFFIVMLPLILTLLYSVWSIQDYTERGRVLFSTIKVSRSSQALADQLRDMERSIRQYQILEDPELLTVFQSQHKAFVDLSSITLSENIAEQIQLALVELTKNELDQYGRIVDKTNIDAGKLSKKDVKGYGNLRSDARALIEQGNKLITIQTDRLSILAAQVKKQVTIATLVSVLLALILGPALLFVINRPIKRIEWAIRTLGNEQLNKRINIEGPRDLREVGRYLEWLRKKLNKLENTKQFFIKTISHELKTPLATLVEGADLLQDEVVGEMNAEQHKIIELLQIANIRLKGLIENLLEYQKATSALAKMEYSCFNINQVIEHICSDHQLLVNRKRITVELEGKKIDLVADRDKIKIIISNLFSNALKYSPDNGKININLGLINNELHLLIADQGPGISKELKPHLFTEFYQQDTPENWKIKGSGLGLSLVRDYVAAHQGKIRILDPSSDYCGAHFLITLPLAPTKLK